MTFGFSKLEFDPSFEEISVICQHVHLWDSISMSPVGFCSAINASFTFLCPDSRLPNASNDKILQDFHFHLLI